MSHLSSPREEFETVLQPLTSVPLERELPFGQRLWQQGWLRKSLILVLLALLWEAVARYQNNDLLLPSFLQTASALSDGTLRFICLATLLLQPHLLPVHDGAEKWLPGKKVCHLTYFYQFMRPPEGKVL